MLFGMHMINVYEVEQTSVSFFTFNKVFRKLVNTNTAHAISITFVSVNLRNLEFSKIPC